MRAFRLAASKLRALERADDRPFVLLLLDAILDLSGPTAIPTDPEANGAGQGWIRMRFKGTRYSQIVDQASMTARMDLNLCRARAPSFDKLCRELENALRSTPEG